jgi:tetratricopeptide (TPR) repeat protein
MPSNLHSIKEALRQSPENLSLLLLYGYSCLENISFDEAQEYFNKALQISPDNIDAQLGLARSAYAKGSLSEAAVRTEQVLAQQPQHAQALLLMSRVLLSENDRKGAMKYFDLAALSDSSIQDPALEQDLGRNADQVRQSWHEQRSQTNPEGNNTLTLGGEADAGVDFMDEGGGLENLVMEWRPETCFLPGDSERTKVTFADVGGMEELKEEIRRKIVYPTQHSELYKAYGKRMGGSILIYGPPGCGKTLILRAIAGEVSCNFISVSLHEVFDPYMGSSERNLHLIFEAARANAPCVLVFDDIDPLAQDRHHIRESHLRNVVNQFLRELDGLRNENILVVAATNQPWSIDPAFRRPGRFDQMIYASPPDQPARSEIIRILAKDKPLVGLDVDQLANATEGFSGADLKWLFERSSELALSEAIKLGVPVPITMDLLLETASQFVPTIQSWFDGAQNQMRNNLQDGFTRNMKQLITQNNAKKAPQN